MPRFASSRADAFTSVCWYYSWFAFGHRWFHRSEKILFNNAAYVTRYTANSYHDFMAIPIRDLRPYEEAIDALIKGEKPIPSASGR